MCDLGFQRIDLVGVSADRVLDRADLDPALWGFYLLTEPPAKIPQAAILVNKADNLVSMYLLDMFHCTSKVLHIYTQITRLWLHLSTHISVIDLF